MSFDTNQFGPLGAAARGETARMAEPAARGSRSSDAVQNGNGNGHAQPLRNGALKREVAAANEAVGALIELSHRISFEVDDSSGAVLVQITDKATGELLQQMPADKFLDLHERLDEIRLLLVDDVG